MAFILGKPFAISTCLKQISRSAPRVRLFHHSPVKSTNHTCLNSKPSTPAPSALSRSKPIFQHAFKRTYMQPAAYAPDRGNLTQKLLYGAALIGGTVVATNLIFNRETREDGAMPAFEREYLNQTFLHTGLGIGIIGVTAKALHSSGWSYRLMATNPWIVIIGGLALSVGSMYGTFRTAPENYVQKYALWATFNATQAAILSPLLFLSPALLARAGIYTLGMMGSIAFVGATAKQEKYLYLGGPLMAGVAIVALSGIAPLLLPATATRSLIWTEKIWLYGGLAVFGGFTLYDVQRILQHARMSERGLMKKDVVNESVSLELDFLNIFIRMVHILGMQRRK